MMRIRDRIADALYQSPGFVDWIRRLTGLGLIWIMPLELNVIFNQGPYHVPAWRIGLHFLAFPEPPAAVTIAVWTLYFFGCIALVAGFRHRFVPVFLFFVWFYYQTLDRYIFPCGFVLLMELYLLGLAIDRQPRSLSRRVIQVAVSTCYIFAALQKFHPEFFNGFTLHDILVRGTMLRPEFLPVIKWMDLPWWCTQFLTYAVIAIEAFIGIGLWFKATRKPAIVLGVILHAGFSIAFPGIEQFAAVIWTGYLAFFDNPLEISRRDLSFKKPILDVFVLIAVALFCTGMPMRLYFHGRFQYLYYSLYDRSPWGSSMFLFTEQVKSVEVYYQTSDQQIHKVRLSGRMTDTSTDNDLIALARYVAKIHPEAERIRIRVALQVNGRGLRVKEFFYAPGQDRYVMHKSIYDGIQLHPW